MSDATLRKMLRMIDVTKALRVSRGTIYNWVQAGTFPQPVPMGDNTVAFYEDEVVAWQKKRERQPAAPIAEKPPIKRRGGSAPRPQARQSR